MRLIVCATVLLLGGCASAAPTAHVPASFAQAVPSSSDAARRGLEAQIAAWNRGDLEAALAAYWDSSELTWVSKAGVQHGFTDFASGMRTDFSNPEEMGVYSAEILEARDLGFEAAVLVFKWQITRDGKRIMGGTSTQIWRQIEGTWRVALEHAS